MKILFLLIVLSFPSRADENIQTILFFGDSITAGYGLDIKEAYPALIQKKIDALKLPYRVINAGLSGDTTAAGERRLRWVLRQKVDVFVLALGANDGLRGIPTETTKENLQKMIDFAKSHNANMKILLAGMQMPPNYGKTFTTQFVEIFPALADKNNVVLIPFLLKNVGGIQKLNLPDRIHPTAEGHAIIANTVWEKLKPLLSSKF